MEEAAALNGSAGPGASSSPPAAATASARPPATPEGMALAYGSLVLMALLPIFFGALRSVSCAKSKVTAGLTVTGLTVTGPHREGGGTGDEGGLHQFLAARWGCAL